MITSSFGQAACLFACAVTSTHGGFLHATETDVSFTSFGGQSPEAVATTAHETDWPAEQAGITVAFDHGWVAPGLTRRLSTCSPFTVTTIVSGSVEQFLTVPEIVTASPGHAAAGRRVAASSTQGLPLQRTLTVCCFTSSPHSFVAVATTANGTCEFAMQSSGMLSEADHWTVAPAATTWLKNCWPLTVTTTVSGSTAQFFTVPETVTASPGQAAFLSGAAVSSTQGRASQRTLTTVFFVSVEQSFVAVASTWNG